VPWLDELRVSAGPAERAEHPVDPVARVPEDPVHAPLAQPFKYEVGSLRHESYPLGSECRVRPWGPQYLATRLINKNSEEF